MVTIEVMCIDDGLLNVGREGVSMRVISREMGVVESGVERASTKLDTTWTDGISDDLGKMVRFTWMGVHLGLLCDAGGVEFLLRADRRDFYGGLVRCELEGIVDVGLICRFGGR